MFELIKKRGVMNWYLDSDYVLLAFSLKYANIEWGLDQLGGTLNLKLWNYINLVNQH
jgi:hypothetical protein